MWPFKWKLSAFTFTWRHLFLKENESEMKMWNVGRNLPLATLGSERVKACVSRGNLAARRLSVLRLKSYDVRPNIIPANFFWVRCVRFSPCHDWDFWKRPGDFRIFPTNFRRLPNVTENEMSADVPEELWALPKLLKKTTILACFDFVRTQKRTQSHHVLKNNLSGFVSQAWEIALDTWHRCLYSPQA